MQDLIDNDTRRADLEVELESIKETSRTEIDSLNQLLKQKTTEIEKLKSEMQAIMHLRETNEKLDRELKHCNCSVTSVARTSRIDQV